VSNRTFTESVVEDAALAWLSSLGYKVLHGPNIALGESGAEHSDHNYCGVELDRRLCEPLQPLVPDDLWFENAEKFVRMAR
jgi:type I restriction enzyme R subunit